MKPIILKGSEAEHMATNPSYRRSAKSLGSVLGNAASEAFNDVKEVVRDMFSSDESDDTPSVEEQAKELSDKTGKNSVTLPDGTRVDLKGRGHTNKATGKKIETPHTHEAESHTNPETGETFTKTKKIPRPSTQEDLDKVKELIQNQE